ncbi:divalent-cation tolerance protein CutA [Roseateles cellulosilyticus]|uniref:Divalent-cation tolerance protein CutA n=1 Tax=Pelomonas cellulosilytica TaxID=2906762 RepID=A0ABS8XV57_9BURK|nr:divalent-cation tolerance protein CutA [Pelomonas sp. P8]MCE4554608.1 divalent-cation tolerance protein CutA [Pelomonas sp. P8]
MTAADASELLAVFTTVATREQADALARGAVAQRLAACVQVEPIHSTYRWQGEVVHEPELRLVFKTNQANYPSLEAWLLASHPYDVPAVFALPVAAASSGYAAWLAASMNHPTDAA